MGNTQKNTPVDIQVRIDKLLDGDSSTKAFASATIGNAFAVHDIRITEKDDKVIVNMPFRSYKANGETKYVDTFHPITAEARNQLYDAVKEAYEQAFEAAMDALPNKMLLCGYPGYAKFCESFMEKIRKRGAGSDEAVCSSV